MAEFTGIHKQNRRIYRYPRGLTGPALRWLGRSDGARLASIP